MPQDTGDHFRPVPNLQISDSFSSEKSGIGLRTFAHFKPNLVALNPTYEKPLIRKSLLTLADQDNQASAFTSVNSLDRKRVAWMAAAAPIPADVTTWR
jgi:hypothetical protein